MSLGSLVLANSSELMQPSLKPTPPADFLLCVKYISFFLKPL